MNAYAQTHTGFVLNKNEDRFLIKNFPDGSLLLAVADGLGGGHAGDVAAEMIRNKLERIDRIETGYELSQLTRIVLSLDKTISGKAEDNSPFEGMGSTLVCAFFRNRRIFWIHIGDSRLYHFRNNRLHQVTLDQTLARFLLEEKEITPEEFPNHYSQQIIDQYLGCENVEPETGTFIVNKNDIILLSSDGLHKYVSFSEIEKIIQLECPMQDKIKRLVDTALADGGKDNITVVLAD